MVMNEQAGLMERCLAADRPWHELTVAYPELARTVAELTTRPGEVSQDGLTASYVELFRTHVQEWHEFASEIAAAG